MDSNDIGQPELDEEYSSFPDFQHLNIDLCLELIFPYLNVKDLANAADTCKQMTRAAQLTFAQKFGRTAFYISYIPYFKYTHDSFQKTIHLGDSKIWYRILRCFGHLISKLGCEYEVYKPITDNPFWTHFDEYISKYCAKYITKLENERNDRTFTNFQKTSFPNVESVSLINCHLYKSLTKLNERFPKMRSLELARGTNRQCTKIDDKSCIVEHFPHLEHLSMPISSKFETGFVEEIVISVLKLNPNLRSLNLYYGDFEPLQEEFVRSISEICKSLDTLQITGPPLRFSGTIHFNSVKTFKIDDWGSKFDSPIPFTFDALETFQWNTFFRIESGFFDFVRSNPTITKVCLGLHVDRSFTHDIAIKLKTSCALVKELEITLYCVRTSAHAERITVFWDNCKSLQRLVLKPTHEDSYHQLLKLSKSLQNAAVTTNGRERSIICQKSVKKSK